MDTGLLHALGFAVGIIVLAVVLTPLFRPRRAKRDINGPAANGRASAAWVGIRDAGRPMPRRA